MNPLARIARIARTAGLAALLTAIPLTAGAAVRKEGAWPTEEKQVDLKFEGKPTEGLSKLAHEAGWSLVVSKDVAIDAHDVSIAVEDQPADAVLEALFAETNVVASRKGTLVTITADAPGAAAAAAPATPPPAVAPPTTPSIPAAPPVPTVRGEDRNVVGGSLTIHKDEIVHTVSVTGGSVKVEGTVTGDLVVAGGSAKILKGGRVIGNATVFGGSLKVENGARIEGDVAVAGGSLKREEGAVIGGSVVEGDDHPGKVKVSVDDGEVKTAVTPSDKPARSFIQEFGQSVTRMAFLFVFGCVLLALMTGRMEKLRVEVASRPMRSFALGLVGTIVGALAGTLAVVVLCITVIGIPVAVVAILAAVFAVYAAFASVLTTFGAAVLGHKTKNPYAHLLFGCFVFLIASSLPWIGGIVTFVVTMMAVGVLVSTRLAGFVDRRKAKAGPSDLV